MFTTDYNTNLQVLSDALRSEQSFDLVKRELVIANRRATMFFIDGLLKDDITEKILEFFYKNVKDENFKSALYFSQSAVPYVEVEVSAELKKVCTDVLSGISALIVEGFTEVILLDTRTYPQRSTSEPDNDKAIAPMMLSGVVRLFGVLSAARRSPSMPTSIRISCQNTGIFCGSLSKTKRKKSGQ